MSDKDLGAVFSHLAVVLVTAAALTGVGIAIGDNRMAAACTYATFAAGACFAGCLAVAFVRIFRCAG